MTSFGVAWAPPCSQDFSQPAQETSRGASSHRGNFVEAWQACVGLCIQNCVPRCTSQRDCFTRSGACISVSGSYSVPGSCLDVHLSLCIPTSGVYPSVALFISVSLMCPHL